MPSKTDTIRHEIRQHYLADEVSTLNTLISGTRFLANERTQSSKEAAELVRKVRNDSKPSLMENFLAEYGLSTKEGVALMCLSEALLRVPDATTIDALIEDKVAFGQWREHLGKSKSSLVNSSTWALMLTGKLIGPVDDKSISTSLHGLVKRIGEPMVRVAVAQAMKELGRQFVLGRDIQEAVKRASKLEARGYTYSYDMLGEAARTDADALEYLNEYSMAITALTPLCVNDKIAENPGISVKLSALHPRYEFAKQARVKNELVERTRQLALQAAKANMGFNIDAEEADRLDLSLDIIESVLSTPELAGWDGFGIVVQAFGQRAPFVIDWLYELAERLDRKIMIRLVKGAYWDAEIKRSQTLGLDGFPVYTRKAHSDISYLCCAEKLLAKTDRIYPQFATHNAFSVAAVLTLAQQVDQNSYEFQRLHGMGESLHDIVHTSKGSKCRIYAPVGQHRDLLAYLVRRLLENGANSSFVNQIVDDRISPEDIAIDPFTLIEKSGGVRSSQVIVRPENLYGNERINAKGWDLTDPFAVSDLDDAREAFRGHQWEATPQLASKQVEGDEHITILNPADPNDVVGKVVTASPADIDSAITHAVNGFTKWSATSTNDRATILERIADLYEQHAPELFALATREAGKTLGDAVGEIREAVDFARYYAQQARLLDQSADKVTARGVITCISPWNFPLAIFTGQVLAAVAAGNAVLAKPADQTPLIAARAVELMHEAGIPNNIVQLLPGSGLKVGAPITSDPRINGVCFTGSTATAMRINRMMAEHMSPDAPLIAETGGLNAMLVDSTALPEQVVRDVIASAFQSAGQRCSALRILYVQEDIADNLLSMLYGAMDELELGNPWALSTDIGPVIDKTAQKRIQDHCQLFADQGRVLKSLAVPEQGIFVSPTVIKVNSINDMAEEIFGPVLHVATFNGKEVNKVIDDINNKGYGLTFGLHTRMDSRVDAVCSRIRVGNAYVNRNQIGAIVGSQPFGGEGLSGTGPKAGGPAYLKRFTTLSSTEPKEQAEEAIDIANNELSQALKQASEMTFTPTSQDSIETIEKLFTALKVTPPTGSNSTEIMPGPTGELNRLSNHPRGVLICTAPNPKVALTQAAFAVTAGNQVVVIAPNIQKLIRTIGCESLPIISIDGQLPSSALKENSGFKGLVCDGSSQHLKAYRKALAEREGEILPLITDFMQLERYQIERHVCIDTTAAGGNASLIAASE